MDTITVKMDFPKDFLLAADITEANAPADIKKLLALLMFKERMLSFGKATELSGLDKVSFLEFAGRNRISLNYDSDDLLEDLETMRKLGL
jgi:predicted HTH domain antitoxin